MDVIYSLFDFSEADWVTLLLRFLLLVVGSVLLIYIGTLIGVQIVKKKDYKIGFRNIFKVCMMYGVILAFVCLGLCAIATINANGLYYFAPEALGFSMRCGYVLMLPEVLTAILLVVVFFVLKGKVEKSIK